MCRGVSEGLCVQAGCIWVCVCVCVGVEGGVYLESETRGVCVCLGCVQRGVYVCSFAGGKNLN